MGIRVDSREIGQPTTDGQGDRLPRLEGEVHEPFDTGESDERTPLEIRQAVVRFEELGTNLDRFARVPFQSLDVLGRPLRMSTGFDAKANKSSNLVGQARRRDEDRQVKPGEIPGRSVGQHNRAPSGPCRAPVMSFDDRKRGMRFRGSGPTGDWADAPVVVVKTTGNKAHRQISIH